MNLLLELVRYLASERDNALAAADELSRDSRRDESDLMRIRANIFDVFEAVCRAARNRENPAAFVREKLTSIPSAWETALAAAQEHGNHRQAAIERIKLDAAAEIGAALTKLETAG